MAYCTYGLGQGDHHFLAGGRLCDPADDPLDPVHPDLELHGGVRSEGAGYGGSAPTLLKAPAVRGG